MQSSTYGAQSPNNNDIESTDSQLTSLSAVKETESQSNSQNPKNGGHQSQPTKAQQDQDDTAAPNDQSANNHVQSHTQNQKASLSKSRKKAAAD